MSPGFARLAPGGIGNRDAAFLRGDGTLKQKVESLETYLVFESLAGNKWNYSRAARELGISRARLADKIRRHKLDQLSFDVERCVAYAREVNPALRIVQVSAQTGEGMDRWYQWLRTANAAASSDPAP